ncbi:LysR family transcriptional regulator [Paraburkholderia megapolitana]|uniref:Transcriptional regulator, LysR family n=1 Tax=Paraburkholderia megapolitana TaxID=420953 RepID=A0A1I3QG06_9BURK|nr:LysR family transcriptional regulator [Paraburkholderia megapolitana]QDQ81237.1 LysR family transcriptional regulator [Paraburkholderia megapolitana]SFJ33063.1 transcriptional regulator, LysR family [Paraburkholderia megapolitana]
MTSSIQPDDLRFFSVLAASGSLTAAARELGLSTAAVSKHLSQMESRAGVALVNRTTRRMSLTPEGELYVTRARRILADMDELGQLLSGSRAAPSGLLRVNATLGFGRSHIAPAISQFVRRYPEVDVQLQLSVDPPALSEDAFDVCIRFGEPPDARVVARRVAPNRRLLCAAPAYFVGRTPPKNPHELTRHNCIGIRQGDDGYGLWRLTSGRGATEKTETVRVRGNLTTNDGEIAVKWALDGHGILMRAEWDIADYLRDGRLVHVLPDYRTPGADIYAVYPQHLQMTARVKAFVDFLVHTLHEPASDLIR